jgi:AraC family transcriptional regulator
MSACCYSFPMITLAKGQFFGQTNETTQLDGLTLTDTEYTQKHVDWHYHENAYFTLILQGRVIEGNRKEVYQCPAGTLLYHHWQECHYNVKPDGYTRGFHIEIEPTWFKAQSLDLGIDEGSFQITHPSLKIGTYNILKESKIADASSSIAIDMLLTGIFARISKSSDDHYKVKPAWVSLIRDILHDDPTPPWSLASLAASANVHPVHLSRQFPKYFACNVGNYIRKLKVQKSVSMVMKKNLALTEIAHACGFSDQSHFIRCFKAEYAISPSAFRMMLSR